MSTQGLTKELDIVGDRRRKWEKQNRRTIIPPASDETKYALAVGRLGLFKGTGRVSVATDILPVVVVRGMPAAVYPKYVLYLTGYTLAAAAVRHPFLAEVIWTGEWERMATVVVSARVGVWAATGHIPEDEADTLSDNFRWSNSLARAVCRPTDGGVESNMFRHFLSLAPSASVPMQSTSKAMMWVSPVMLLAALNHLIRDESSYTGNILEAVIRRHIRESRKTDPYLDLASMMVWDTFRAASTAAYGLDRLRALARDGAFSASAQLRVAVEGASQLRRQLEVAMAEDVGDEDEVQGEATSDNESVADTEVGFAQGGAARRVKPMATVSEHGSSSEPEHPPPLDPQAYRDLTESISKVKAMTPAWGSMKRAGIAIESEVRF